ncbi:altered inheritance of mitochondria protein 24, mitochondrial [Scheffersomyces xylosifermentans]|uniref:altered inheritance of mitochondria protein 24, mitochondrial n=1 Tax=Scheffersomyces xylosifermentans TaxID=1304137 RepID=UPI00315CD614
MIVSKLKRFPSGPHLSTIRSISIAQPPTTITGADISQTTTAISNIQDAQDLSSSKRLEIAEFKALGNPPSVLSINSPPSVPVFLRRGTLLSIYGLRDNSSIDNVRSTLEVINPLKRWLYGGYVASYQRLISTTPYSMLISSTTRNFSVFKKSENRSFVNVLLDGSSDWAILNKDALQVYSGNSLVISLYKLPSTISRKLSKQLGISSKSSTGLFKWTNAGYTLLSGRGQVGLVGNGSVYNITLNEGEELLVNRNNLLGVTVNGPYDLQNCIIKYSFAGETKSGNEITKQTNTFQSPRAILKQKTTLSHKTRQLWSLVRSYVSVITSIVSGGHSSARNFLVGNQDFVKIIGPRNLLLQSNTLATHIGRAKLVSNGAAIPTHSSQDVSVQTTSSDYLSYVTITPTGAKFESTPDFKETVKKIENR